MAMGDALPSKATLASQAFAYYTVGKYDKALEALQMIAAQLAGKEDPRVQFNTVLSEHAKAGFKEPLALRDRILAIRNSLKERSVKTVSRAKDSLRLEDDTEPSDDTDSDTSILLYNLAALHFHEKQYAACRQILSALFTRIEVLDESLGVHVCFLLLDVLLHSARGNIHTAQDRERFAFQTAAVLSYLERPHTFASPALPPSENDGGTNDRKDDAGGGDNVSEDGSKSSGGAAAKSREKSPELIEFAFRLHLYKAKVLLVQEQIKFSKKEIKSALEIFQRELRPASSEAPGGKAGESDDEEGVNVNAGANPVLGPGDPSLPPPSVQNMAALYLKANLEYLRHNYRKALKLLASCHRADAPGPSRGPLYFNNMGCLHYKMGLYNLAVQYFHKALQCFEPGSTSGKGLESDGRVCPHALCEVVYNTGVQLLLTGQYVQAFRCFENASLLYYNRPRLWMRMAECCIQQYREEEATRTRDVRERMFHCVVGSGKHRRVVLPTHQSGIADAGGLANGSLEGGKASEGLSESKTAESVGLQGVRGQCNLQYACRCLQNVLFLLANTAHGGDRSRLPVTSTLLGSSKTGMIMNKESPGAPGDGVGGGLHAGGGAEVEAEVGQASQDNGATVAEQEQDEAVLERVALLNLSYVHLCLREPVLALRHAQSLLALPGVSEAHQYIARTYAAEACCLLNRPTEARTFLKAEVTSEAGALAAASIRTQQKANRDGGMPPPSPEDEGQGSGVVARTGLCVNLAGVYAQEGNLPLAEEAVKAALLAGPTSPDALRMLIWVLLRRGRTAEALEVLKYRRGV